jgi:hypothetical protein
MILRSSSAMLGPSDPVLIGQGIPLFGALSRDIPLRHVRTRILAGGLVQSEYDVGG